MDRPSISVLYMISSGKGYLYNIWCKKQLPLFTEVRVQKGTTVEKRWVLVG